MCIQIAVARVAPLVEDCTIDDIYRCRVNGISQGYKETSALPSGADCIACVPTDTDVISNTTVPQCTVNPVTNVYCRPPVSQCIVCGYLQPQEWVSTNYLILFRKYCNPACDLTFSETNVITLDQGITLSNINGLTLDGAGAPMEGNTTAGSTILQGPCPILNFYNVNKITIKNLVIQCTTSSRTDIVTGIVFAETTSLELVASNMVFMWYVREGITVLGGKFVNTLPAIRSVDMSNTVVSTLSVQETVFVRPSVLSIGNYYGVVDGRLLEPYSRVIVLPVLPPSTSTTSSSLQRANLLVDPTNHPIIVKNYTMYTSVYGPTVELEIYNPGKISANIEASNAMQKLITWVYAGVLSVAFFLVVFHQDKIYYYHKLHQ